jgi:hypothetical protein
MAWWSWLALTLSGWGLGSLIIAVAAGRVFAGLRERSGEAQGDGASYGDRLVDRAESRRDGLRGESQERLPEHVAREFVERLEREWRRQASGI